MAHTTLKKGDKVTCSGFLYEKDYIYRGAIGVFIKYNRYGDDISYVCFGQNSGDISCDTDCITKLSREKEQLLFDFMNEVT